MISRIENGQSPTPGQAVIRSRSTLTKVGIVAVAALALAGCRDVLSPNPIVKGWQVVEHTERFPILISKEPSQLSLNASRGSYGMSAHQKHRLSKFLRHYRTHDAGNSRITIHAPAGTPNEVAAMHIVHEARRVISDHGFDGTNLKVETYHDPDHPHPPVRISYLRYVAEAPKCGVWKGQIGYTRDNTAYSDFGCSSQANLAAQVANPADLLGPRTQTPRVSQLRRDAWDRMKRGQPTRSVDTFAETANTTEQQ